MGASERANGPGATVVSGLVWFHRWIGVATCLIFALWFASGAVLLFQPFPSLAPADRAELAEPIDLGAVQVSPGEALAIVGPSASGLRLIQRGASPAFVVASDGPLAVVDAVSGKVLGPLDLQAVGATSAAIDYDQWVVHNQFDQLRPLYRMPQGDPAGTVLYKSAVTGELVQRTTQAERAWNWVGAVLHWVYFTPLRASYTAWDQTVWWLSLVCTLVAFAGIVLGILRTAVALKQRAPSLSFYRVKWMRWHHILGLFSAIFVLGWIVSGWLSMDHGRLFSRGLTSAEQSASYMGRGFSEAVAEVPLEALRALGNAAEIGFTVVAGQVVLTPTRHDGSVDRYTGEGKPLSDAGLAAMVRTGVTAAWSSAERVDLEYVDRHDMYALAEGWPLPSQRARLMGDGLPEVIVDGRTGSILTVMDASRKSYAWVYYALHTFNFPGLTNRPLLREVLVLIPLLLGFAFSITGVVIGWRRVRKSF